MKRLFFDANILLRLLLNDIPSQTVQAEKLLIKAKEQKIAISIPEVVIFETYHVLRTYYKYNKERIISIIEPLVATDYLEVESRDCFLLALSFYKKESVSFVDCFLLAKAQEEGIELFTFDKKLLNLQKAK